MTEGLQWGGDDFPPGDRELWEEQYMRGRVADSGLGETAPVDTGAMPIDDVRERFKQLHTTDSDPSNEEDVKD
jgi:hypothetical protein